LHSVSARAETVTTIPESAIAADTQTEELAISQLESSQSIIAETVEPASSEITYSTTPMVLAVEPSATAVAEAAPTVETTEKNEAIAIETGPTELPTVSTSASALLAQTPDVEVPPSEPAPVPTLEDEGPVPDAEEFPSPEEALPEDVDVGQPTRSGYSYIGVAGNIGVGGDTAIGNSGISVISKIGLTRFFSVRPSVDIGFDGDDIGEIGTVLLPVTLDFFPRQPGEVTEELGISIAPYVGAGAAIAFDEGVAPLITGGLDIPISRQFTANAAVNVGFFDPVDIGVRVGIGYNFNTPGLF
jgi:hypothetical protein